MQTPRNITTLIALAAIACGICQPATSDPLEDDARVWMESGFGGASVDTRAAELPGERGAAVLTIGMGYRATRHFGIGAEYASSASLSGCHQWGCGGAGEEFKPSFNRISLFGEVRMLEGSVRLRYGLGSVSYCYSGGYGFDLWYLLLQDEDELDSHTGCDSTSGRVHSASIGYHWRWWDGSSPMVAGLRLGVEQAKFRPVSGVGVPGFRYRAATLTLQISLN
jgi:hypothetical protein